MYKGSPVRTTADLAVLVSGKPIRIFHAEVKAKGSGVGTVEFRDGTGASDTALVTLEAEAGTIVPAEYSNGLMFPNGLFLDVGGDVDNVVVWAELVSRA